MATQPAIAILNWNFLRSHVNVTRPFVRYFLAVAVDAENAFSIGAHELVTEIMHDSRPSLATPAINDLKYLIAFKPLNLAAPEDYLPPVPVWWCHYWAEGSDLHISG